MGVTAVLAAVAVVGTMSSIDEGKRSARRQKRAGQLQTNAQMGQDRDSRTQSLREQRIRRSRILQAGENTGTSGSSQEIGALGSLNTIFSAQMGQQKGQALNNIAIGNLNQQAADANSRANTFGAISSLASQGASMKMQYDAL